MSEGHVEALETVRDWSRHLTPSPTRRTNLRSGRGPAARGGVQSGWAVILGEPGGRGRLDHLAPEDAAADEGRTPALADAAQTPHLCRPLEVTVSDFRFEEDDGVAVITIDRADVRNAVNGAVMDGIAEAVTGLKDREDIYAVILTGAGEESLFRGDLKWLQRYDTGEKGQAMSRMQANLDALNDLPMLVIAVLNGYASAGAELAPSCDLRVMEAHAFLCFKQAQMGSSPGDGGGRLLAWWPRLGHGGLGDLPQDRRAPSPGMGSGQRRGPQGAGLAARKMVARIRRESAIRRAIKQLLQAGRGLDAQAKGAVEADLFRTVWASPDHQEALAAFFEKRRPNFERD